MPFGRVAPLNKCFFFFLIFFFSLVAFTSIRWWLQDPRYEGSDLTRRPRANLFSTAGKKTRVWRHIAVGNPDLLVADTSVLPLLLFSLDLGFFCFIWGSAVFIENLFFYSGQILDKHVVLLYLPLKITVVSQA